MSLPMLQVALDNQTLASAYETTRLIAEEVDIIEVGTILCVGEGVRAVRDLKALYPHKIVLADAKIADAGKILSRMCFEANADWVTVICCADINTAKGALDVAKEFNGDVQIELTGFWTWEQAQAWREAGIQQVVYHRSRDAQAAGMAIDKAEDSRSVRDECETYLDDYVAYYAYHAAQPAYGYGYAHPAYAPSAYGCCRPGPAIAREPKCTETVEYVYEDVPVRPRARRMPSKRVRIVPDKRIRVD